MDPSPTAVSERLHVMENRKSCQNPKLGELEGTAMTLSGEDESLIVEATQNLVEFAVTKGHTIHSVTSMSKNQLADFLRDFYGKIKLKNDDAFTLKDLRAGLHKFFIEEASIDILRDRSFELANATFYQALKANPRKCHRMRIEMEDLKKIYLSDAMDTNKPDSLQNKVFFDISLYICNKGKDYFRAMKKNDFKVSTDIHGRRYVWLKDTSIMRDEEDYPLKTKRLGVEEEDPPPFQVGERMYERRGDPRCPLSSFLKYVTHLHPMADAFWQRPKRNVSESDYVWYDHAPLGSSTLTKIMQRISSQAGLSDNYTNYSIRTACIPLVEAVCEEALRAEGGGFASPNSAPGEITKPLVSGHSISHSASEDISSDDGLSQTSDAAHAGKDAESAHNGLTNDRRPPRISRSVGSGSLESDDVDICGLMQAKAQVLELIRGLMVKDIQKFVDWLKTVRVQYSSGELIVLCSPVDKSNVEPIPDDITVDRNGVPSRTGTPDPSLRKSMSLDISEKRMKLKKETSLKGDIHLLARTDVSDLLSGTSIKQVEFSSTAGVHCSSDDVGDLKVAIPSDGTLLLTGVPENMQVMLHKKRAPQLAHQQALPSEPLSARVFSSENEMDVADIIALASGANNNNNNNNNNSSKVKERTNSGGGINNSNNNNNNGHNNYLQQHHIVPSETNGKPQQQQQQQQQQMTILQHKHQQQSSPMMLTIPAAHTPTGHAMTARDHFKDHRNKSMGCIDPSPPMIDAMALKRVSSTGTPVLKRQAHVSDSGGLYPENLSVKKLRDDSAATQATNLSMKPAKKESPEAKKARADRLTDSLRYHTEILQNSPLVKKPGERNFSGFRHCYANTVGSAVKAEPQDTSYS